MTGRAEAAIEPAIAAAIVGASMARSCPPPTPPIAPAMVFPIGPILMDFTAEPTALPPIAPVISWIIRFMTMPDMLYSSQYPWPRRPPSHA